MLNNSTMHAMLVCSIVVSVAGSSNVETANKEQPMNTSVPSIPVITLPPRPPSFGDIPSQSLSCYDLWASAMGTNAFIKTEASRLQTSKFVNYTSTWAFTTSYDLCSEVLPTNGPFTTLCDGIPRNVKVTTSGTCGRFTNTYSSSLGPHTQTETPPWISSWSASHEVPAPTCTAAPDYQNLCYRLHSLYSWRTSQAQTATFNGTMTPEYILQAQRPSCKTWYHTPASTLTTKSCFLGVDDYAVYYWPSAAQPGTSFCANTTRSPGGTPTVPGVPNTAVVSGFTLTSPSVYHFLKGVAVSTSIGESQRGRLYDPVYSLSTYNPDPILTVPQMESDIWTAQPSHTGHGWHAHWKYHFANGSFNADAMTMAPLPAYLDSCRREKSGYSCNNSTILQAHFRQHAALSVKQVLKEWKSAQFEDCIWQVYDDYEKNHDIHEMWIAPGEPWRATPIVTAISVGAQLTRARPGSTLESIPVETATSNSAL